MIAAILEALANVAFDILIWTGSIRWVLFSFFLLITVICFASKLYSFAVLALCLSVVCALWPRKVNPKS